MHNYKWLKVKGMSRFKGHRDHLINAPFRQTDPRGTWGQISLIFDNLHVDGTVTLSYDADCFAVDADKAAEAGLEIVE